MNWERLKQQSTGRKVLRVLLHVSFRKAAVKNFVRLLLKNDPDSELIQDETINQSISSYLPLYMVPSEYQYGKSIPLSANGKVDRKMVAELFFKERQAVAGYEKPQGAIEEELERLWIEVLGSTKYSRDISFFQSRRR